MQGQLNDTIYIDVDREGFIVSDLIPPVLAMGKNFKNLKKEITKKLNETFLETSVFITLGELKNISVKVVGEVVFPNQYTIGPLSSLLDALTVSGGVKKSGSLRNIQILRNNEILSFDLYDLIYAQSILANNLSENLQQGDIIIVPKIKSTFALSGEFLENGIFELGKDALKISDVMTSLGGSLPNSKRNISIQRIDSDGKINIFSVTNLNEVVKNGDIVFLSSIIENLKTEVKIKFSSKISNNETGYITSQSISSLSEILNFDSFNENDYTHSFILKPYGMQNLKKINFL